MANTDYSGYAADDDQAEEPEETVEETVEEVEAPKGPVFERGKDGRIVDTNK